MPSLRGWKRKMILCVYCNLDVFVTDHSMAPTDTRPECSFGSSCYRRNPHHFKEYKHHHLAQLLAKNPDLELPGDSSAQLKQQLKIYSDIEHGYNSAVVAANAPTPRDFLDRVVTEDRKDSSGKADVPKYTATGSSNDNSPTPGSSKRPRSPSPPPSSSSSSETGNSSKRPSNGSAEAGGKMSGVQAKLRAAAPFNYFLTKVRDCPASHKALDSIYLTDILHPSLGKLTTTLQINFMVELDWLTMNYEATKTDHLPLVVLYGAENPDLASSNLASNIRAVRVKPKYPYGTHHTKMMVLMYDDGSVRVVVHTANLVPDDWHNRTQGVWVSDKCPKLGEDEGSGESPTGFKASLLRYLKFYEVSVLQQFISAIQACDMSHINTAFVSSVPNSHKDGAMCLWGHRSLSKLLRLNVPPSVSSWPVKIQCSSIGSLGISPDMWLEHELGTSLSSTQSRSLTRPKVSVVYPSHSDVLASYDGPLGGGCLPYSGRTAAKQPWLVDHMHHWRAEASSRTRAMPHIKTYTRTSPDNSEMAFFMLTSANMSKAAWGSVSKAGNSCMIMSYEAGVVWLPKFVTGEEVFKTVQFKNRQAGSDMFPLHYDLPLTKYGEGEKPWLYDYLLR